MLCCHGNLLPPLILSYPGVFGNVQAIPTHVVLWPWLGSGAPDITQPSAVCWGSTFSRSMMKWHCSTLPLLEHMCGSSSSSMNCIVSRWLHNLVPTACDNCRWPAYVAGCGGVWLAWGVCVCVSHNSVQNVTSKSISVRLKQASPSYTKPSPMWRPHLLVRTRQQYIKLGCM